LEELEEVLKASKVDRKKLESLCNKFYSLIPHDFGFKKPPMIDDQEALQQKMDLLEVLGDIEVAQTLMDKEKGEQKENPIDAKYKTLCNDIVPLEKDTDEWKKIQTFLENTKQSYKLTLLEVYKLDRHEESAPFKKHNDIEHRRLLWHGSKVAVFAAILSTGLKIMPHSGGRVGRGLYFADICAKSASYCGLHNNIGLMLLNEVVLGKQNKIIKDDPSLVAAPPGYNSVLACGTQMPDESHVHQDKKMSVSGNPVLVPQGAIKNVPISSSFLHNEYLVYDASQVNMKYLLKLRWN